MEPRDSVSISLFPAKGPQTAKTVIIFGVARGGTSMVAGAVRGLGFYLGPDLINTNEDPAFSRRPDDKMKATILERSAQHNNWGWKFPGAASYLDEILPLVRNPYLIVVSRDIIANALGHVRWHKREATLAVADILAQIQRNLILVLRWRVPTLFVSYEKATANPDQFIDELSHFLGEAPVFDKARIADYLKPGQYKDFEDVISGP